jgi:hypothetical protein
MPTFRVGFVCLIAAAAMACGSPAADRSDAPVLVRSADGRAGDVSMVVEANSRVSVDSIMVTVTIKNHGEPIRFFSAPEYYTFGIVGPAGELLQPKVNRRYARVTGPPVTLARGDSIYQTFNLACGPFELPSAPIRCNWQYSLLPGEYRIVGRYLGPLHFVHATNAAETMIDVESDTLRTRVYQ